MRASTLLNALLDLPGVRASGQSIPPATSADTSVILVLDTTYFDDPANTTDSKKINDHTPATDADTQSLASPKCRGVAEQEIVGRGSMGRLWVVGDTVRRERRLHADR